MAIRERFEYVVDLTTDNAQRGIRNIETAFRNAEGPVNRFKAAGSAALQEVKANALQFGAIAGAAIAAFGAQSVRAFQDAAIEAGKFGDATGLSTEAASRWIEVGGDIGITGENMRSLFTRLNKAIGDNAPVVSELGIETVKLADGTTDVNGTMLVAIERLNRIKNPTERAAAAQRLFGRNYAEAAELIFGSADELKASLEGVSDAIAIDDEERVKAERLRAAFDELGDTLTEVQLIFGEYLAPKVVEAVGLFRDLRGAIESVNRTVPGLEELAGPIQAALNPLGSLAGLYGDTKTELDNLIPSEADFTDGLVEQTQASVASAAAIEDSNEVVDVAAQYAEVAAAKTEALAAAQEAERAQARRNIETTRRLTDEYNTQRDRINDLVGKKNELIGGDIAVRQAQRDAKAAAEELNTVIEEQGDDLGAVGAALDGATESYLGAAQAAADFRADQLEANGTIVDGKVRTQLLKEELQNLANGVDGPLRAAIQRYIDDLGRIPSSVNTNIRVNANGSDDRRSPTPRASGGPTWDGGFFEVAENGKSEVYTEGGRTFLLGGAPGEVVPLDKATTAGGGGMKWNTGGGYAPTLNVHPGAIVINGNVSGDDVVRALDAYVRRGGFVPVDVRRKFSA